MVSEKGQNSAKKETFQREFVPLPGFSPTDEKDAFPVSIEEESVKVVMPDDQKRKSKKYSFSAFSADAILTRERAGQALLEPRRHRLYCEALLFTLIMILAGSCLFFGLAFGKYKRLYNEIRMDCLPAQQMFEEDFLPENTKPIPISTMMPFEEYGASWQEYEENMENESNNLPETEVLDEEEMAETEEEENKVNDFPNSTSVSINTTPENYGGGWQEYEDDEDDNPPETEILEQEEDEEKEEEEEEEEEEDSLSDTTFVPTTTTTPPENYEPWEEGGVAMYTGPEEEGNYEPDGEDNYSEANEEMEIETVHWDSEMINEAWGTLAEYTEECVQSTGMDHVINSSCMRDQILLLKEMVGNLIIQESLNEF